MCKRCLVLKKYKKVINLCSALFCCVERWDGYSQLDYAVDTYISISTKYGYKITNRESFKRFLLAQVILFENKLTHDMPCQLKGGVNVNDKNSQFKKL